MAGEVRAEARDEVELALHKGSDDGRNKHEVHLYTVGNFTASFPSGFHSISRTIHFCSCNALHNWALFMLY